MNDSADRKVAIFTEALQFSTEERSAYLSRVCAGDLELRRQVDELLRSHDEAGDMLTRYLRRAGRRQNGANCFCGHGHRQDH